MVLAGRVGSNPTPGAITSACSSTCDRASRVHNFFRSGAVIPAVARTGRALRPSRGQSWHPNLGKIVLSIRESNLPLRVYPATAVGDDRGRPVSLPDSEDIWGSLACPAGVIFPSFISFQALAVLYFDQLDPFRLGEYRITHLSSSKRLYHPSIQPKHRASSRAWRDGNLSFFGGRC